MARPISSRGPSARAPRAGSSSRSKATCCCPRFAASPATPTRRPVVTARTNGDSAQESRERGTMERMPYGMSADALFELKLAFLRELEANYQAARNRLDHLLKDPDDVDALDDLRDFFHKIAGTAQA